jgi:hypothetical protein
MGFGTPARLWKVTYQEHVVPTLMRLGANPCAASGTVWIDPASGEIFQGVLECVDPSRPDALSTITVKYRRDERLGLRLPVEKVEHPEADSGKAWGNDRGRVWVEGKCTYSNYRRFETGARLVVGK